MKFELIEDCRQWWRLGSVWTMGLWAVLGGVIVQIWPVAQWALNEVLPHDPLWRIPFAVLTVSVTFGSMLFARLKMQPKLQQKLAEKRDAQV
jgi:hypothetical protein